MADAHDSSGQVIHRGAWVSLRGVVASISSNGGAVGVTLVGPGGAGPWPMVTVPGGHLTIIADPVQGVGSGGPVAPEPDTDEIRARNAEAAARMP